MISDVELRKSIRDQWARQWWQKPEYDKLHREIGPLLNQAIQRVSELFNGNWGKYALGHPMGMIVFSEGLHTVEHLLAVGRDLIAVDSSRDFDRVTEDLRIPSQYQSARLELLLAAHLSRSGHTIKFRPTVPGNKEADFIATLGSQTVYFEIKRLEEPQEPVSMSNATSHLIQILEEPSRELTGRGWGHEIVLDAQATKRIAGAKSRERFAAIAEIGEKIRLALIQAGGAVGCFGVRIPEVAEINIGPGLPTSIGYHPSKPTKHENQRIVGRLKQAARQLHPDHPGIIAIQTPQGVSPEIVEDICRLLQTEKLNHVIAVLVFPVTFALPVPWIKFPPFYITKERRHLETISAFSDLLPLFRKDNRAMTVAEFFAQQRSHDSN